MEKSLVSAVRAALLPTFALPVTLAGFGSATTDHNPSLQVMAPILLCVLGITTACWGRVLSRWPGQGRSDDDDQWWRDHDDDGPRSPGGGSGGPAVDWLAFERDFAAYVRERAQHAKPIPVTSSCSNQESINA